MPFLSITPPITTSGERYRFLSLLILLASFGLAASCSSSPGSDGAAGAAGTAGKAGEPESAGSAGANVDTAGAGGDSSSAGAADTSGAGEAGASQCDDGDDTTRDFYQSPYGCGHLRDSDPQDGMSWIVFDAGFSADPQTGYGWIDLSMNVGSGTLADAQSQCEAFSVGGLGNWRVPTIDEARTLAAGCAATASGGTCPIHDASCLTQQCGYGKDAECSSCQAGGGPAAGKAYCNPDSTLCTFFHTSSLCSDCASPDAQDWEYGPSNGNFTPGNVSDAIATVCVTSGVLAESR